MSKKIVLARPHPFIVAEMRPFLEKNGYAISKVDAMANLASAVAGSGGAVISLALSSSIPESAEEVFKQLRQITPRLPVLFASMLSFDQARPGMERLATSAGIQATFCGVASEVNSPLGTQESFLYFSKDDLADPARRAIAARMIQRHFGR